MAHKKVIAEPKLRGWTDADDALRQIHEAKNTLAELDADQNRRIDAVKDEYKRIAQPLKNRIAQAEADLMLFTDAHRAELEGKSRRLTFGSVGYRVSSKINLAGSKLADAIARLKSMGLTQCIKTTETLDKEMLRKQHADVIMEVGASISTKDEFYYDIDHAELTETAG